MKFTSCGQWAKKWNGIINIPYFMSIFRNVYSERPISVLFGSVEEKGQGRKGNTKTQEVSSLQPS